MYQRYRRVFNFFFIIGVCPFIITKDNEVKVPRFFVSLTVIKVGLLLAAYLYTMFGFPEDSIIGTRISVSILTISLAVFTISVDFILLQFLVIMKYKKQRELLLQLLSLGDVIKRITGPGAENEEKQIHGPMKNAFRETRIKSLYLLPIPIIVSILFRDLRTSLITFSFLTMFYAVLYQSIYNRLFLVILNESIDRYLLHIKAHHHCLRPMDIVGATKSFHRAIVSYNGTFKHQNLILIECSFIVLLLCSYITSIALTESGVLFGIAFLPILSHVGYDFIMLIWTSHSTTANIRMIKRIHSREMEINVTNYVVGSTDEDRLHL